MPKASQRGVRRALEALNGAMRGVERAFLVLSGLALVGIMVLVTVSALGRYAFSSPIEGSEVWVGVFLAPLVTYLALGSALSHRQHVGVSLVVQRLGPRLRRGTQIVGALIVSIAFTVVGYEGAVRTWNAYTTGQVETNIGAPLWLAYVVIPLGCACLALRSALLAVTWWLGDEWRISLVQQESDEARIERLATSPAPPASNRGDERA